MSVHPFRRLFGLPPESAQPKPDTPYWHGMPITTLSRGELIEACMELHELNNRLMARAKERAK